MNIDEWYKNKYHNESNGWSPFENHVKEAYKAGFDKAVKEASKVAKEGHTYTPTSTAHNIAKRIKELKE